MTFGVWDAVEEADEVVVDGCQVKSGGGVEKYWWRAAQICGVVRLHGPCRPWC